MTIVRLYPPLTFIGDSFQFKILLGDKTHSSRSLYPAHGRLSVGVVSARTAMIRKRNFQLAKSQVESTEINL